MKNPSTISSGESDERAAFEAHMRRTFPGVELALGNDGVYRIWRVENDWMLWQARAALATQPAESKACASVGVEPAKLSRDIKEAIQELGGGSFPDLMEAVDQLAALASPVGEPVAWAATDETCSKVEALSFNESRRFDTPLYFATPPAAPAATEAPSSVSVQVVVDWIRDNYQDHTIGSLCDGIRALATPAPAVGASSEPSEQLYRRVVTYEGFGVTGVVFEPVAAPAPASEWLKCEGCGRDMRGHDRMGHCLPAVGASEREEGFEKYWVARADFDKMSGDLTRAKNLLVRLWDKHPAARAQIEASTGSWFVWGQDRDVPVAVGASVQPAAGALPPVRWWSGVVGSPEKLANLLDGYSEKKESPRRDERVMRAAAKWIREVVASVQPVLASLSDEQITAMAEEIDNDVAFIAGFGRGYGAALAALASSTPTKGGEAS